MTDAGEPSTAAGHPAVETSLIISSRDRHRFLEGVVGSILAGTAVPDELVVVDQSPAGSAVLEEIAARDGSPLRYIVSEERGLSRGRNLGIAKARGRWLFFVDDDIVVPDDWFERISRELIGSQPRTVVTGRVTAGEAERDGGFAPSLSLSEERIVYRGRPGRDVLQPLNMAMPRTAFDEVGLFDVHLGAGSHFPSSEDNDLGFRLLEAGYAILYDPSIVVIHRAWRSPGAMLPLRWSYGRGQGAYFAKHFSRHDPYMAARLRHDLWRHLRRAPRRTLVNVRDGAADLVYSAALMAGATEWLLSRSRAR
jgi:GT2 family glycosyltransferase